MVLYVSVCVFHVSVATMPVIHQQGEEISSHWLLSLWLGDGVGWVEDAPSASEQEVEEAGARGGDNS